MQNDRLVLIIDDLTYRVLNKIDDEPLPVSIEALYEIDSPNAIIRGIYAEPIEKIGEVLTHDFDYIVGAMDMDRMLYDIICKLNLSHKYLSLTQFKERYLNKEQKMQYLKQQMRQKCEDFKHPALYIDDYTYCIKLELFTDITGPECRIGKFCSLSDNVKILLGIEHRNDWISTYPFNLFLEDFSSIEGHPSSKGDVIIGNDVCIGLDTVIMSGVTIGNGCVIGARSVVAKSIPPYSIAAGNPAKVIRKRFPNEWIDKLMEMKWWNWPDEMIYDAVPLLQSQCIDGLFDYWKNSSIG